MREHPLWALILVLVQDVGGCLQAPHKEFRVVCMELPGGVEAGRTSRGEAIQEEPKQQVCQMRLERHDLEPEEVVGTAAKGAAPKRSEILPPLVVVAPSMTFRVFRHMLQVCNGKCSSSLKYRCAQCTQYRHCQCLWLSKCNQLGHQLQGRMECKDGTHIQSQRMMNLGYNNCVKHVGSFHVNLLGTQALTLNLLGHLCVEQYRCTNLKVLISMYSQLRGNSILKTQVPNT